MPYVVPLIFRSMVCCERFLFALFAAIDDHCLNFLFITFSFKKSLTIPKGGNQNP
jgi:hypothetical protein